MSNLSEQAAQLNREAQAVINNPSAMMIPPRARGLLGSMGNLLEALAREIDALKGAGHDA